MSPDTAPAAAAGCPAAPASVEVPRASETDGRRPAAAEEAAAEGPTVEGPTAEGRAA
ncbi:hypothetical protein [Streptomyces cyslabdanicus]|uniref:hypothetical protein n=1 Tax=Streptomyces cyslabdanicus TaxID=1470456 RepID=UPI00404492C0